MKDAANLSNKIVVHKRDATLSSWSDISPTLGGWNLGVERTGASSIGNAIAMNRFVSGRLHLFVTFNIPAGSYLIYNKYTDDEGTTWINGTDFN